MLLNWKVSLLLLFLMCLKFRHLLILGDNTFCTSLDGKDISFKSMSCTPPKKRVREDSYDEENNQEVIFGKPIKAVKF